MLLRGKGAVLVNLDGRIAYASTQFCELLGVTTAEIVGMSCFDFVFPEDMEEALRRFEENKQPQPPFRFRLRRKDGSEIWVDIQGAPMRSASGELYGITAAVEPADITSMSQNGEREAQKARQSR